MPPSFAVQAHLSPSVPTLYTSLVWVFAFVVVLKDLQLEYTNRLWTVSLTENMQRPLCAAILSLACIVNTQIRHKK